MMYYTQSNETYYNRAGYTARAHALTCNYNIYSARYSLVIDRQLIFAYIEILFELNK